GRPTAAVVGGRKVGGGAGRYEPPGPPGSRDPGHEPPPGSRSSGPFVPEDKRSPTRPTRGEDGMPGTQTLPSGFGIWKDARTGGRRDSPRRTILPTPSPHPCRSAAAAT